MRYNDLYTLDMSNLHWERVHGGIAKVHGDARDKVPKPTTTGQIQGWLPDSYSQIFIFANVFDPAGS